MRSATSSSLSHSPRNDSLTRNDPHLDDARRVNGDAVVLSYAHPFSDLAEVLGETRRIRGVERAEPFAVWEVQLYRADTGVNGLLKVLPFGRALANELRLPASDTPRPKNVGRLPDVVVGRGLAVDLGISRDAEVEIVIAPAVGTRGAANIRCSVRGVVEFRAEGFNKRLIYADLSHVEDFKLHLTGIQVRGDGTDAETLASRIQERFSGRPSLKVFSMRSRDR